MLTPSDAVAPHIEPIRAFIRDKVMPLESRFLVEGFHALEPTLNQLRDAVRERGWWLPQASADLGGMGLSLVDFAHLTEVLGASPLGHYVFGCQAPDAGNLEILHQYGNAAQHERFLAPLCRGEIRSCFGMTEPDNAGSNPTQLSTRAVLDGDSWVLDGHKWFTTAADGASLCVVMAVTDPEAGSPYARASMILVPTDTPGFSLVRNISVMGEAGEGWSSHGEVRLDGVRVPKDNLLGGRGAGFVIAQQRLGPGRIHHCMRWIGIAERAFDLMCTRAATRDLGGGRPLGTRQTIQNWVAESRAEIDASRMLVLKAAHRIEEAGSHAARSEISIIKFYVAGVLQQVVDRAIQVHGALGMTDDTILAWFFRHERAARIYDGPDEVHKAVVARRILRGYGMDKAK